MGLFDAYSPTGSEITNISALSRWAYAVSRSADLGIPTDDALTLAKATGEPLSSPLGRWLRQISETAEAGGAGGVGIFDALKAAQVQLSSPFGRWAASLSRQMG